MKFSNAKQEMSDKESSGSESDFDEDDDPDKIEIPGKFEAPNRCKKLSSLDENVFQKWF